MQEQSLSGGRIMKRTSATLSIVCSLALLAGCGGESEKTETPKADTATTPAATGGDAFARAKGKVVYSKTCIACHGEGGVGVENLGKNWIVSDFIKNSTDEELLAFIRAGRTIDDPMSAGNAPMPPSGGDPTLTDKDLQNVIVYMRSLQK